MWVGEFSAEINPSHPFTFYTRNYCVEMFPQKFRCWHVFLKNEGSLKDHSLAVVYLILRHQAGGCPLSLRVEGNGREVGSASHQARPLAPWRHCIGLSPNIIAVDLQMIVCCFFFLFNVFCFSYSSICTLWTISNIDILDCLLHSFVEMNMYSPWADHHCSFVRHLFLLVKSLLLESPTSNNES